MGVVSPQMDVFSPATHPVLLDVIMDTGRHSEPHSLDMLEEVGH